MTTHARGSFDPAMIRAVFPQLVADRRWVAWRTEWRGGRPTKVPVDPATGRRASSTDPATWRTLDDALRAAGKRGLEGVGIMLGEGLGGVDLDGCRNPETGQISNWARNLINMFVSYSEVSPSGTGVKILASGAPDKLPANTIPMGTAPINGKRPAVECYVRSRFFAITGHVLDGLPDQIRDCGQSGDAWDQLVNLLNNHRKRNQPERTLGQPTGNVEMSQRLRNALKRDRKLRALWRSGKHGGTDRSRNDATLATTLAARGFDDDDIEAAIRAYPLGQIGQGVLTGKHAERQIERLLGLAAEVQQVRNDVSIDGGTEQGKRDLTHDGLALEMGDRWHDARYVAAFGRWMFYDGWLWGGDETLQHMTRCRVFLRDKAKQLENTADEEPDEKQAARLRAQAVSLRSAYTVAQVVGLARTNKAQAATAHQWDVDPWLLGTPGGTVDLRTGTLRPPRPEDYITRCTAVAPAPAGTSAPRWSRFLDRITEGNPDLQAYLQRFAGYALTGSIREHAFAFGHGTGANGKGVTISTWKGVLGDYSLAIPTEMLMVSDSERHPTELARLRGVRLAIGSEVEQGKRWAEANIKRLTGGDRIPARFMRQDFFEFDPQFKLFIVGNHRPSLRGVDEAIRRRLHLVPFTVTIPEEERDPELIEKLRDEWPAILRWMIDGCLAWQQGGLNPPSVVRAATDEYLEAEDAISLWLDESAGTDPGAWEATASLFASWKRWAEAAGEFVGSQKRFAAILQERGFEPKRQGGTGTRGYQGIRLHPVQASRAWEP